MKRLSQLIVVVSVCLTGAFLYAGLDNYIEDPSKVNVAGDFGQFTGLLGTSGQVFKADGVGGGYWATDDSADTNGLASTNWVMQNFYLISNPSNYVDASITNGFATMDWAALTFQPSNANLTGYASLSTNYFYPANNPSNYITSYLESTLFGQTNSIVDLRSLSFVPTNCGLSTVEGGMFWCEADGTLSLQTEYTNVVLQVGQEFMIKAKKDAGDTILNGNVVYVNTASGDRPEIALADAFTNRGVFGFATADFLSNEGMVTAKGLVRDVDTGDFSAGDLLYVGSAPGSFTNVQINGGPVIGYVLRSHGSAGIIFADPVPPEVDSVWTSVSNLYYLASNPSNFLTSLGDAALKSAYNVFSSSNRLDGRLWFNSWGYITPSVLGVNLQDPDGDLAFRWGDAVRLMYDTNSAQVANFADGNFTFSTHILFNASNVYDVGSLANPARDVYIGPGSLWLSADRVFIEGGIVKVVSGGVTSSVAYSDTPGSGTSTNLSDYNNDPGFVTSSITNGLASTNWVLSQSYVTASVTNGLASTNWVLAQGYGVGDVVAANYNVFTSSNKFSANTYWPQGSYITFGPGTDEWRSANGANGFWINNAERGITDSNSLDAIRIGALSTLKANANGVWQSEGTATQGIEIVNYQTMTGMNYLTNLFPGELILSSASGSSIGSGGNNNMILGVEGASAIGNNCSGLVIAGGGSHSAGESGDSFITGWDNFMTNSWGCFMTGNGGDMIDANYCSILFGSDNYVSGNIWHSMAGGYKARVTNDYSVVLSALEGGAYYDGHGARTFNLYFTNGMYLEGGKTYVEDATAGKQAVNWQTYTNDLLGRGYGVGDVVAANYNVFTSSNFFNGRVTLKNGSYFDQGPGLDEWRAPNGELIFGAANAYRQLSDSNSLPVIYIDNFSTLKDDGNGVWHSEGTAVAGEDIVNWTTYTNDLLGRGYLTSYAETSTLAHVMARGNSASADLLMQGYDVSGVGLFDGTNMIVGAGLVGTNIQAGSIGNTIFANRSGGIIHIESGSAGASVRGYVGGTRTIRGFSHGALSAGNASASGSVMDINNSPGAYIRGIVWNSGDRMVISGADGASIFGSMFSGTVTNTGRGSIVLVDATSGHAKMSGGASIGLGKMTCTHSRSIVLGDGQISYANESVTAGGGFYGEKFFAIAGSTPSAVTNMAQFFATNSSSAEMYVIDGAGNVTLLSAHDKEVAVNKSWNKYTGRGRLINEDAIGIFLQALYDGKTTADAKADVIAAGHDYIYKATTPKKVDWDTEQASMVADSVAAREQWASNKAIFETVTSRPYGIEQPALYVAKPKPQWLVDALQ